MGSNPEQPPKGAKGDSNGHPLFPELGYTPIVKVDGQWEVEKVLDKIDNQPAPNDSSPLAFFHILERLKTTKREGWRRFGIERYFT